MMGGIPTFFPDIMEAMGVMKMDSTAFNALFEEHLKPFLPYLGRKEQVAHFFSYQQGLLSDLERKSIEPIALAFEGGAREARNLMNFMSKAHIDDQGMLREYQKEVGVLLADPTAMLTGDGSDFPKQGKNSVGVASQYCGNLGKVANCQAGVFTGIASPEGSALLDFELYMPEKWFDDAHGELRAKCRVPEGLEFKTKNQMLSAMIVKAVDSGIFKGKYVGVDCSFGKDHVFLDSIPEKLIYFADVPSNQLVFLGRPEMLVPEYSGKGRRPGLSPSFPPRHVKDLADDPSMVWQDVVLGNGAKGPITAKDKCVKVVECRDGKPGKAVWLYIRKLEDGSIKYALCNESMDATLEMVRAPALMRWSIEQLFKECKDYLGMDHYEARGWTAWRRHILFTLIAHLFLTKLRRKFSVKTNSPGPAPIVLKPVPLDEYMEAVNQATNNQPITSDNIRAYPEKHQQVLTIGLVMILIQPFIPKLGRVWAKVKHCLKRAKEAYWSHSRTKIARMMKVEASIS